MMCCPDPIEDLGHQCCQWKAFNCQPLQEQGYLGSCHTSSQMAPMTGEGRFIKPWPIQLIWGQL